MFCGIYLPRRKGDREAKMLIIGVCWWMVQNRVWGVRCCNNGIEFDVFASTRLVCQPGG